MLRRHMQGARTQQAATLTQRGVPPCTPLTVVGELLWLQLPRVVELCGHLEKQVHNDERYLRRGHIEAGRGAVRCGRQRGVGARGQ